MNMKKSSILWSALAVLALATACSERDLPNDETMQFTSIKWKLTSFVINGKARTPDQDSDDRYWLLFKEDNTLEGKSFVNELSGTYEMDMQASSFRITNLGGTKIGEPGDGQLFVESLQTVRSFKLRDGVLKLYYNETDYFLFRPDSEFVNPYVETIVGYRQEGGVK
jgi:heat shock protein HslJ